MNVVNDIFVQVIVVGTILIELYAKNATHNQPYNAYDSACSYFSEIKLNYVAKSSSIQIPFLSVSNMYSITIYKKKILRIFLP